MLNQCQFIGNLGADPEIRSFQSGGRVCNLRLAVTEKWKDRASGERKEKTEWISVAIFNDGLVGVAERFLRKGSKIYIEGKWETRKWQDQSGQDKYSTECVLRGPNGNLVMLDGAPSGGGHNEGREVYNSNKGGWQEPASGWEDPLGDDVPF